MAKNNKKVRKAKGKPTNKGTARRMRARDEAKTLLYAKGDQIGFMGGMALAGVEVIGINDILPPKAPYDYKVLLAEESQFLMRQVPRTWTLAVAFISEVDGEITVHADYKIIKDVVAKDLDIKGTEFLFERSEEYWNENTFCSLWISVPKALKSADDIVEYFDADLERLGFFNRQHVAEQKERNAIRKTLEEQKRGVPTIYEKAKAISEELKAEGYPVEIRLVNAGRWAHSVENGDAFEWGEIGGVFDTHVGAYIDESKVEAESIHIPEDITDIVKATAERHLLAA